MIESTSKDGKFKLRFDEGPHTYEMENLTTLERGLVPGVTTFNKDGYPESIYLSMWKAGEASKFAVNALLGYLSSANELKEEEINKIVSSSKRAWMKPAKAAADIGTIVHDYAYADLTGTPFDEQKIIQHFEAKKILSCISQYREWKEKNPCKNVLAEQVVGSPSHGFAGKLDRLDELAGGVLRLRDYKTSSGIYLDMFVQMESYVMAVEEWLGLCVHETEVVRFGKDGEFESKTSVQLAQELGTTNSRLRMDLQAQVIRNRGTYGFRKLYEV